MWIDGRNKRFKLSAIECPQLVEGLSKIRWHGKHDAMSIYGKYVDPTLPSTLFIHKCEEKLLAILVHTGRVTALCHPAAVVSALSDMDIGLVMGKSAMTHCNRYSDIFSRLELHGCI